MKKRLVTLKQEVTMPLFYKGIQAAKANKEGVKTWHPALVKMKK